MRGPSPAPHLAYRSPHGTKRNAETGLFSLRSIELIQRLLMQYPNLNQVFLRFFDVVPYSVEFVPDRNDFRTITRLCARARSREASRPSMRNTAQAAKAFRLCTSSPIDIGSILKFAGTKRLKWAPVFLFSCLASSMSAATRFRRWLT
jgi:hypothetical protein